MPFFSLSANYLPSRASAGWVPCSTNGERHSTDTMGVSQTQCSLVLLCLPPARPAKRESCYYCPSHNIPFGGGESQTQHRQLTLPGQRVQVDYC